MRPAAWWRPVHIEVASTLQSGRNSAPEMQSGRKSAQGAAWRHKEHRGNRHLIAQAPPSSNKTLVGLATLPVHICFDHPVPNSGCNKGMLPNQRFRATYFGFLTQLKKRQVVFKPTRPTSEFFQPNPPNYKFQPAQLQNLTPTSDFVATYRINFRFGCHL